MNNTKTNLRPRSFKRLLVALFAFAGISTLIYAGWQMSETFFGTEESKRNTAIKDALIDTGRHVTQGIERVTRPALLRGRMLAKDTETISAIGRLDFSELTQICNKSIRSSTEIDAVAIFNTHGEIIAINTVYADGSPIPRDRVDRIMSTSFVERDIIMGCLENDTRDESLEFQTTCDITPAFFDSSGLSVAHSLPIFSENGERIGVVSTRLRFDRISELINTLNIANGEGSVYFVNDMGGFFNESLNSNSQGTNQNAPIPTPELKLITQPLTLGEATEVTIERQGVFHALFRMNNLTTIEGGGIQTMISVPDSWVHREARAESILLVATPAGIGFLLLLVGVALRSTLESQNQALIASLALDEYAALRAIFERHSIVSETDAQGNISRVNSNLTSISGYSPEELIGQDHNFLNSSTHPKSFWESLWQTLETGNSWRGEICNRAKDGTTYWADTIIAPSRGKEGNIDSTISISTDITDRKNTEQNLSKNQNLLEGIFDSSPSCFYAFDQHNRFIMVNEKMATFFNMTREEMLGKTIQDVFAIEIVNTILETNNRILVDGQTVQTEELISISMQNSPRVMSTAKFPLRNAKGMIYGVGCVSTDITDQKQSETKLALTTALLERTGELAQVGGWSVDLSTMKLSWTRETFRITEIDPPIEPDLESGINLFAPEARPIVEAAVQATIDYGTPYDLELPLITAKGKHRWVQTQGYAEIQDGKSIRIYGTFQDITDRKEIEDKLAASERRLRTIIEAEPECVKVLGPNDEVLEINAAGLAMLQADSIEQVRAIGLNEFVMPEYQAAFDELHTKVRNGQSGTLTFEIKGLKGTQRWLDTHAVPLRDEAGNVISVLGVTKDITDLKMAEVQLIAAREQAESASLAKSAFLANMSHEIRTPLTAILGFTELLQCEEEEKLSPELRHQTIDLVQTAGNHLLTVINDILDISKIEANMMTIELIETSLPDILREVESLIRPKATEKGLSLTTTITTPLPVQILSDPTRLRQILINLTGNAVKFTEQGSCSITVSNMALDGNTSLIIDVEDTGPGLTKKQSALLFQAFGQADETVTRKYGGNGLGLTISRRLAALMGGDVKLIRSIPGEGSCFRLVLPLKPVTGTNMISSLGIEHGSSLSNTNQAVIKLTGRILLAEDGADNQRLISHHLKKAGAMVDIADNGLIAMDLISKAANAGTPYNLLLTDMQMPEMDGYSLARLQRQMGSKLPIVALTAHAMAEDQAKCLDAGCDDYATKPIDKTKLLAICAKWMEKSVGTTSNSEAA